MTTSDLHLGKARGPHRPQILNRGSLIIRIGKSVSICFALAHAGHLATAVNVVEHMTAIDVDHGAVHHQGCVDLAEVTFAATKHVAARSVEDTVVRLCMVGIAFPSITNRSHLASVHIDLGALLHDADLATAIHIAKHIARDRGAVFVVLSHIDLGIDGSGETAFVKRKFTTAAAKDMTTIAELFGNAAVNVTSVHIREFSDRAIDVDRGQGLSTACIVGKRRYARRADRGQRAAAVDVAVYQAAVDGD